MDVEEFYTDGWTAGHCIVMIDSNAQTVWLSKNKLMGKQLLANLATGEIHVPGKELLKRLDALMQQRRVSGSNIFIPIDEGLSSLNNADRKIHFARLVQPPQTSFGRKFEILRKHILSRHFSGNR